MFPPRGEHLILLQLKLVKKMHSYSDTSLNRDQLSCILYGKEKPKPYLLLVSASFTYYGFKIWCFSSMKNDIISVSVFPAHACIVYLDTKPVWHVAISALLLLSYMQMPGHGREICQKRTASYMCRLFNFYQL